jgi:hypothetical protein
MVISFLTHANGTDVATKVNQYLLSVGRSSYPFRDAFPV